jgi:hypothetical protein
VSYRGTSKQLESRVKRFGRQQGDRQNNPALLGSAKLDEKKANQYGKTVAQRRIQASY